MPSPASSHVERFRSIVQRRLGLDFDEQRLGMLEDVLQRRVEAGQQACELYLERLESPQPARDEWRALARELTVTETYFFRNPDQFQALVRDVLPARTAAQAGASKLRILSAGCASGEEAYSLVIHVRENLPDPLWSLSVRAVDVNPAMLERARQGRYTTWSLRETPLEVQSRWFTREGRDFLLDDAVRRAVVFEERNLADDNPDLWEPGSYDVVFCRNVLMYLSPETARGVVQRIARALVPGGNLFLGHAETLRGLSQAFHLEHTQGTFYYRSKDRSEGHHEDDQLANEAVSPLVLGTLPALMESAATWVEAIGRATDRIQALSEAALDGARQGSGVPAAKRSWDLGLSLELLEKERFGDALELVHGLPPESARDPEVLLLRAALLTHGSQFERAEAVCAELLQIDEMNGGAHYLLALCREGSGDPSGAVEHDRIAAYLDPTFAMPRLHLGLLARRVGDPDGARLEFSQALMLLQREDASRLLLFGGGFGRDALMSLCRTGVAAVEGAP